MLKVHIDDKKDIKEIEAEGQLLDVLVETGSVVEAILLDSYKKQKIDSPNISLEEYITPFFDILKDAILKFHKEDEIDEKEIIIAKAKLNRKQATEIQKILESKNDEALLNFLKNIL